MVHILARLIGVKSQIIKQILLNDAPSHAKEGLFFEYLWQNMDNHEELLFLFRKDNMHHAKKFIKIAHSEALKENPSANLPTMTYLEEK